MLYMALVITKNNYSASGRRGIETMSKSQDLQWFIIHTRPHQEKKVKEILENEQNKRDNIMDIYSPSNTIVRVQRGNHEEQLPLFAGRVFVLTTQEDATTLLTEKYPEGYLEYDKTQKKVMTIPELQMLFFMDFNEHYPEKVLVLERPYSDYTFNTKNNEPNEAIKVIDGPFQGKTGYLVRFRGNRRLVFQMEDMAICIPDIWDYHLTRLHNNDGDRQSRNTLKARIVDFIVGKLQDCGFIENTNQTFIWFINTLIEKSSFAGLQKEIEKNSDQEAYRTLNDKIKNLSSQEASLILSLANYVKTNPDFMDDYKEEISIRPFLTPTSGIAEVVGKDYAVVRHKKFMEVIRKLSFKEDTFYPKEDTSFEKTVSYYAHIGIIQKRNNKCVVFANFDKILKEYFLLGGQAKDKQLETFKNYCPLFYQVLKGENEVKTVKDLSLGATSLNVLCIHVDMDTKANDTEILENSHIRTAIETLTKTSQQICLEINSSTHLAIWRKFLRSIWLHL